VTARRRAGVRVQNSSLNAPGGGGQLMGYNFLSVAVEFDTYYNGDSYDPNANHVAVQSRHEHELPNHPGSASSCTVGW
jgi:hypothetical protein